MTEAKLFVNEKAVPLKEIMQTILTNVIDGFVSALDQVPDKRKTITIEIRL